MSARIAAGWIVLATLLPASAAQAWPHLDVTASEVVSTDPPRYRTTFTIVETGATGYPYTCPWVAFIVSALDPASPEAPILESCSASAPWTCVGAVYGGVPTIQFYPAGQGGDPFRENSFSIVTDRVEPCVRIEYYCVILLGGPPPAMEACLAVDMPTPASPSSWGQVKAIFR
jgi:hypothetical protein